MITIHQEVWVGTQTRTVSEVFVFCVDVKLSAWLAVGALQMEPVSDE